MLVTCLFITLAAITLITAAANLGSAPGGRLPVPTQPGTGTPQAAGPAQPMPTPTPTIHHHIVISGTVKDRLSGIPIVGAEFTAWACDDSWRSTVETGHDGTYFLTLINGMFHDCHVLNRLVRASSHHPIRSAVEANTGTRWVIEDFSLERLGVIYPPHCLNPIALPVAPDAGAGEHGRQSSP
jgi:hypothetical protein